MTVNIRDFGRNVSTDVLWILVVVYAVVKLVNPVLPLKIPMPLVILIPIVFGLIHGALRYKWSGILTFLIMCLVVSNLLENTSILTGFPFGHYSYTDVLGPKLFLVPLLIGPTYFATGYLAWVLGTVLIGDSGRTGSWFTTLAVPFIASLDLGARRWLLRGATHQLLGVVLHCVYVLPIVCPLPAQTQEEGKEEASAFPESYYAQALIMYAVTGLAVVVAYFLGSGNTLVTDAMGVVWQTRSIAEAQATVSIFTMIFVAALSTVKLLQRSAAVTFTSVEIGSGETAAREISPALK